MGGRIGLFDVGCLGTLDLHRCGLECMDPLQGTFVGLVQLQKLVFVGCFHGLVLGKGSCGILLVFQAFV